MVSWCKNFASLDGNQEWSKKKKFDRTHVCHWLIGLMFARNRYCLLGAWLGMKTVSLIHMILCTSLSPKKFFHCSKRKFTSMLKVQQSWLLLNWVSSGSFNFVQLQEGVVWKRNKTRWSCSLACLEAKNMKQPSKFDIRNEKKELQKYKSLLSLWFVKIC